MINEVLIKMKDYFPNVSQAFAFFTKGNPSKELDIQPDAFYEGVIIIL